MHYLLSYSFSDEDKTSVDLVDALVYQGGSLVLPGGKTAVIQYRKITLYQDCRNSGGLQEGPSFAYFQLTPWSTFTSTAPSSKKI